MAELTEKDLEAIHDTHDKVIKIDTILGNGGKGLCYEVQEHGKRINRVELVIVSLCSSGVLGGGILGLIKWLGS